MYRVDNFVSNRYNISMAEITGITPQIKDKTRCNIEVDGRFYCGMKLETVMKNRLKVGVPIDGDELSRLQLESEKTTALDKALTHISSSMKTERQVRDFLRKKGYLSDVCDYVVEKMREYAFLNDGEYARAYAESAGKKKGRRLIALELRRKGIDEETIENAVSSLSGEKESAFAQLKKYLRGKPIDRKTLSKGYAYLIGKGYDYETAKSALSEFGDTEDED